MVLVLKGRRRRLRKEGIVKAIRRMSAESVKKVRGVN